MFTYSKLVTDYDSGYVSAFFNLVGSSVLTWHPAGLAAVTCMLEEPMSLQGRQSADLWLLEPSLRLCFCGFGHIYFLSHLQLDL